MNIGKILDVLEDLKAEDVKKRVAAVRNLDKVTEAMGVEKTRQQVLPFLKEYEDDEEEVLVELARQLVPLAKFIGDTPAAVVELISYFTLFLAYEDASVVEEGFKTLETILTQHSISHDAVLALAKRLQLITASKAQASASRICCRLYSAIPQKLSSEVQRIINDNSAHKTVFVRKETAASLRHLLDEGGACEPTAATALKKLLKDAQESVKIAALEAVTSRVLPRAYYTTSWHAVVLATFDAKNWKLRFVLAKNLPNLVASSAGTTQKALVDAFFKLITDPEKEVSMRALETLPAVVPLVEADAFGDRFFQVIKPLMASEDVALKKLLAAAVPQVAPNCTTDGLQNLLRETVVAVLKDENAEVKVSLLSSVGPLTTVFSSQQIGALCLAPVLDMLSDKNWKVRKDALSAVQVLVQKLGESFASNDKVIKLLKERLADRVFETRKTALETLRQMCSTVGSEWARKQGLPLICGFTGNTNYLYRLNYVWGIVDIAAFLPVPALLTEADTLVKLLKDPVANVRYQACLSLFRIYKRLEDNSLESKLVQALRDLEADSDSDMQKLISKPLGSSFKQVYARLVEQQLV